jgi:hypothetical protein
MNFSSNPSRCNHRVKPALTVFSRSLIMGNTFPSFTMPRIKQSAALASSIAAICMLWASPAWAFESGSTGADGALNPAVNTVIQLPPSGILNYTTINIPVGVRVTFQKNTLNTPVYLLASGNVTVAGTIDVSGGDSTDTGTSGSGNQADDGIPGAGGPGGFAGGIGGEMMLSQEQLLSLEELA